MRQFLLTLAALFLLWGSTGVLAALGQDDGAVFNVVAFSTGTNDKAHVSFVREANQWFAKVAAENHFAYQATSDWNQLNAEFLAHFQVVIFLDTRPEQTAQREAFQKYMERGGAWMGFHFAGFALTPSQFPQNWDWYHNEFLGSGSYLSNTWRPASAILRVEDATHPATRNLPKTFKASPNEWYRWTNDLRQNPDIRILLSIDPASFPLGTGPKPQEIWRSGYYPVVWTHRKYRMLYVNMGHNDIDYEHNTDKELSFTFANPIQNQLILDGLRWLGSGAKADPTGDRLAIPATQPATRSSDGTTLRHALVLAERGGLHEPYVVAAGKWLNDFAAGHRFEVDYVENTKTITAASLERYQVIIQLNYPPYGWTPQAAVAFREYIEKGRGGWVGFHHATLLGEFDGYPMWTWFSDFMGGIRFKQYIATFVAATVHVERPEHPVLSGLPASFPIEREEWYTYDRSPRDHVRVLASVDEKSYAPPSSITMGDHPVVWTNERVKARNVYIFMGHGAELLDNPSYTRLVGNAILWAGAGRVP